MTPWGIYSAAGHCCPTIMIEIENTAYLDRLSFSSNHPDFERTESILRGFVIKRVDYMDMNTLGSIMKKCKDDVPGWDIEFAPRRNSVFQWMNSDGKCCVVQCVDIDLPFIIDNKPADKYEQCNILKKGKNDISIFMKDDVDYREMEKMIVLSRAFSDLGFETVDWIYLN